MRDIHGLIYKAQNRFTGFVYIGQTKRFETRKKTHLEHASLKSSNLFEYDLAKYGEDIKFSIVCYCENQETLDFLEALLIRHYMIKGKSYNTQRSANSKIRKELTNGKKKNGKIKN